MHILDVSRKWDRVWRGGDNQGLETVRITFGVSGWALAIEFFTVYFEKSRSFGLVSLTASQG